MLIGTNVSLRVSVQWQPRWRSKIRLVFWPLCSTVYTCFEISWSMVEPLGIAASIETRSATGQG